MNLHKKTIIYFNEEVINYKHITKHLNENDCKIQDDIKLTPIDGVCNERIINGKLYTDLNVYKYDSINNIPLDIMNSEQIEMFDNNKNNKD